MILFFTKDIIFILIYIVKGIKELTHKNMEYVMKKIISTFFVIGLSTTILGGCTNTEVGTTVGGATGAGLGYAVSGGSGLGAVVGAGAGALIGNSIGQEQDRRAYYYSHPYYRNGYNYYY